MARINFSARTYKANKVALKKDILQAVESSPAYRKEIARVFQMANRRIQNIEAAGVISPAVSSLNKGDIKGYSKFNMKHSWDELKIEYAKAISFLRQPTSTAGGAREYNKHLATAYKLTDDEFNMMAGKWLGKILSIDNSNFIDNYLFRYKDFTGELEAEISDVSQQIESDAINTVNRIDRAIQEMVDNVAQAQEQIAKDLAKGLDSGINAMFNKFGIE